MSDTPITDRFEEAKPSGWAAQCLTRCVPGRIYRYREEAIDKEIEEHPHEMEKIPLYTGSQVKGIISNHEASDGDSE